MKLAGERAAANAVASKAHNRLVAALPGLAGLLGDADEVQQHQIKG